MPKPTYWQQNNITLQIANKQAIIANNEQMHPFNGPMDYRL